MIHLLALLALPADAQPPPSSSTAALDTDSPSVAGIFDPVAARGAHLTPGASRDLSKKEEWLRDKSLRPDLRTTDGDLMRAAVANARRSPSHRSSLSAAMAPSGGALYSGERLEPTTTLFNVWTREALPILPGEPMEDRFHGFLRDHFTNQATHMDPRLVGVLTSVANKFAAKRIEIVSGYRSPKYNLMLRKKGHQVARHSQHMEGNAVDFRVRGVPTRTVLHYVRSLRIGGVGYYPHSQFVHTDTGKIRYWTGS